MQKLLIADISEEFCDAVAESLSEVFDIRHCCEGNRALELMKSFRPDIVCIDLMLPGLDGLSILEQTISSDLHPTVLVIGDCISEYVVNSLNRLGVNFVIRKPCVPSVVAARLIDLRKQNRPALPNPLVEKDPLESLLCSLQFNTKSKNYNCVKETLKSFIRNPKQAITKELYPSVAAACGGNKDRIEKAVRDAIHFAWKYRENAFWQRFFPECCRKDKCPSNGMFIYVISMLLSSNDRTLVFSADIHQQNFVEEMKDSQLEAVIGL